MKRTGFRSRQRGVVLALALVMLVMITLIAVVALRGVTTEERISANLRASSVAFEQSELALSHCEQIALIGGANLAAARIDITDPTRTTGEAWPNPNNWIQANNPKLQLIPSAEYLDPSRPVSQTECMIEEVRGQPRTTTGGTLVPNLAYAITARGFGDNNGGFRTTVQSQLRPPPL